MGTAAAEQRGEHEKGWKRVIGTPPGVSVLAAYSEEAQERLDQRIVDVGPRYAAEVVDEGDAEPLDLHAVEGRRECTSASACDELKYTQEMRAGGVSFFLSHSPYKRAQVLFIHKQARLHIPNHTHTGRTHG